MPQIVGLLAIDLVALVETEMFASDRELRLLHVRGCIIIHHELDLGETTRLDSPRTEEAIHVPNLCFASYSYTEHAGACTVTSCQPLSRHLMEFLGLVYRERYVILFLHNQPQPSESYRDGTKTARNRCATVVFAKNMGGKMIGVDARKVCAQ